MTESKGKRNTASSGRGRKSARKKQEAFLKSEAAVLGTFAVSVFLFLSNFHICGFVGDFLSQVMLGVFGTIGYVAPVLLFAGMVFYTSNRGNIRAVYKMLAVEILLVTLCALAQLMFGGGYREGQTLKEIYNLAGVSGKGGGLIGGALVVVLHTAVGTIGAYLILLVSMIICIVCITEKSFVAVVKTGSGRAYQYAREDYGRRKVVREERREEKRLLREEQKVHGVNLGSTNLMDEQKTGAASALDAGGLAGAQAGPSSAVLDAAAVEQSVFCGGSPEELDFASRPNPADVFKGEIAMTGYTGETQAAEKEEIPFVEDERLVRKLEIAAAGSDEDVFLRHDTRTLEEMDMLYGYPAGERREGGTAFNPAPDPGSFPVPGPDDGDEPAERNAMPGESADLRGAPGESAGSSAGAGKNADLRSPEGASGESAGGPERPFGVNYDDFYIPEEQKIVRTASGKVIETETEEILKKKLDRKKMDAAEIEAADQSVQNEVRETEKKVKKEYVYPPVSLLTKSKGKEAGMSEKEFKETAIKLQQTLRDFGVGVTVTNISCGPTVTRYELHPEQGVKVSKILSLADDIKLNLAAADIRIEAPIPGKAAVGIEVPNKVNSMVYLRDLIESEEFKKHPSRLAFAVGKDIAGQVIVSDLAKMPHLLIAGQTGSGKSVGINTMIMSLIYRSSPDDVKLIMIDPKVVELSVYNGIPHLLIPVVTDPKKAAGALNWAVAEMTDRYQKFAECNVRDLKGYNARIKTLAESGDAPPEQIPNKLPQIVIIIDELADLMMVASNEVEDAICRLAQLARAAGLHLVIATQRPSVNVITGVIKANVPSRIAFSVASGVDSRTVIDMNGAEKLLGNGDMLFYPSGYPKPVRVQGAFVSDGEVSKVTDFLKKQEMEADYNPDIQAKMNLPVSGGGGAAESGNDRDALFADAGKFIIEKEKASIGMLQRMFKIGFNRAARIMDQLSEAGVVGEEEGTKPRKVLMSMEEFEAFLEAGY